MGWRWNRYVGKINMVGDIAQLCAPRRVMNKQFMGMSKALFDGSSDHSRANDSDLHHSSQTMVAFLSCRAHVRNGFGFNFPSFAMLEA